MTDGPLLTSERLEFWKPRPIDAGEVYRLVAPDSMREYLGGPTTEAEEFSRFLRSAGSFQLYGYGMFMLRERGAAPIVGIAGAFRSFRGFGKGMDDVAEVGWIIGKAFAGRGFASEAVAMILAWFDRCFDERRTVCMIEDGHAASIAVARRAGFVEYARHQPDEGRPLVLFERTARSGG